MTRPTLWFLSRKRSWSDPADRTLYLTLDTWYGVEPLVLKGWAAARLYGEPGLRPYGDLDLCVLPSEEAAARTALQAPGAPPVLVDLHSDFSPQHRDHPSQGCPSAALLDEISRSDDTVRQAYTDGILSVIDLIAARVE